MSGCWCQSLPEVVSGYLGQSRLLYVRNPCCRRLHVSCSNWGARSAILSYWDRESASAKAFSLVDTHLASKSKSYSEASSRHLCSKFMDPPRMVRLETACAEALLSTWIISVILFHSLPQCRSTCSTARISWVLMCSLPQAGESGMGIENADPGPGWAWFCLI